MRSVLLGLLCSLTAILAGCAGQPTEFHYRIDASVRPTQRELTGLDHGPPRPTGAMVGPKGERIEFVSNEIILHPSSQAELDEFIGRYNATVLRDGRPAQLEGTREPPRAPREPSGWYLLRIDTTSSSLDDLEQNMERAGLLGNFRFSSEQTARLMALFARELNKGVGLNLLMRPAAINEHPMDGSGNIDSSRFVWFTEDDDATMPGDQGLSTGVIRAWQYLEYKRIQAPGINYVPRIAIIDAGFAVDEGTGLPLGANADFWSPFLPPWQADLVDYGWAAGENPTECGPGNPCPWHGQGAFGIAAARSGNSFGSAGSGGRYVIPMLYRIDADAYTQADAIRSAAINGADVINLSWSGGCGDYHWVCSIPPADIYDMFQMAVNLARTWGSTVVVAAGNNGVDVGADGSDFWPCEADGVICVGAVNGNRNNVYNFGAAVDIWAPDNMLSTVTPQTAALDANNTGQDELYSFAGTSAASPFVAGVVGLMKASDPDLFYQQVLDTLQATSNASPDPLVSRGYVDAFRAVQAILVNQPPTVQITTPSDGLTRGWQNGPTFSVTYADPEVLPDDIYKWHGEVVYSSDRDGELCRSDSPPYGCSTTLPEMSVGAHTITATATDAFGAVATDAITVNVVSRPPAINILQPTGAATLHAHLPVNFAALAIDPDEFIPDQAVNWTSNVSGPLGMGWGIASQLPAGQHVITASVTDGKGLTAQDQVTITVQSGAGLPLPQITGPPDPRYFSPGAMITLTGTATDPEDGVLPGTSLEWRSDIDGFLGTGTALQVTLSGPPSPCNPEYVQHTITLKAEDSNGNEISVTIKVNIGQLC